MGHCMPGNDKQAPRERAPVLLSTSRFQAFKLRDLEPLYRQCVCLLCRDYILATVKIMDGTAGMFAGFVAIRPRPGALD